MCCSPTEDGSRQCLEAKNIMTQLMVQQVEPLERVQVHCVDWPSSSLCFRCSFQNSVRQWDGKIRSAKNNRNHTVWFLAFWSAPLFRYWWVLRFTIWFQSWISGCLKTLQLYRDTQLRMFPSGGAFFPVNTEFWLMCRFPFPRHWQRPVFRHWQQLLHRKMRNRFALKSACPCVLSWWLPCRVLQVSWYWQIRSSSFCFRVQARWQDICCRQVESVLFFIPFLPCPMRYYRELTGCGFRSEMLPWHWCFMRVSLQSACSAWNWIFMAFVSEPLHSHWSCVF